MSTLDMATGEHAMAATTLPIGTLGELGRLRSLLRLVSAGLVTLVLAACSGIPISYYDATTYTQLTSLKAETGSLIEVFDTKAASQNEAKIETVTLNLRKAYEYEKGKGAPNSDTTRQFEKLFKLFTDTVQEARDNAPASLGPKYFSEASKVLGQAFDIAIATENTKNKDKR
jgi:hypothetical protein